MNITELSPVLANANLQSQVGIKVLDQTMESAEAAGAGLIHMIDRSMELAVNPNVGGNFDMTV